MGLLERFEDSLDRLVNGAFARAFKAEVQPVEIASALQREIGDRAAVIDRDRTVIPNVFHVELSEHDYRRLAVFKEALQTELQQLADALKDVWGERLRVSRWPVSVPMATRLFPQHSFDLRALVALHAQGLAHTLRNDEGLYNRDRAFRATAELLLFQHSCHWFCRSKTVASARVLQRHQTGYEQVLAAVSPGTREAYTRLVNAGR